MSKASDIRERALCIREAALGFSNEISRTLLELAGELEAKAADIEKAEPDAQQCQANCMET